MKKVLFMMFVTAAVSSLASCGKKCSDCPAGTFLAVDEPEDGNCICCPDGTTYAGGGVCQ